MLAQSKTIITYFELNFFTDFISLQIAKTMPNLCLLMFLSTNHFTFESISEEHFNKYYFELEAKKL